MPASVSSCLSSHFGHPAQLIQPIDQIKSNEHQDKEAYLFDAKTIDSLHWPETENAKYAQKFLTPLVKRGIHSYIENIQAELYALKIQNFVFPVIVTTENYENSYVCSPYGHYVTYGQEFASLMGNPFLTFLVKHVMGLIGKVGKFGHINSIVYVNHWLFSTDLYPKGIRDEHLSAILELLSRRFPNHAIIFRSLNRITCGDLLQNLKKLNFLPIASRPINITDTKKDEIFRTRIIKSDLKLWGEHPFEVLDEEKLSLDDFAELLELHHSLFAYRSSLQPKYNLSFFQLLHNQRLLRFKALKEKEDFIGMAGYMERDGVMLCPLFGYNKNHPEHAKIYRVLSTALLLEAQKKGLIFHQSAGASFYKQIRRAESCLESMAVYTQHLSYKQKMAWKVLCNFINKFSAPYMKKY